MKRLFRSSCVLAGAAVVLSAASAWAQPSNEIYLSYSYLRADTGTIDLEGGGTAELESANTHGTEISGTWFVTRRAGIEVTLGYNRGSFSLEGVTLPETGLEIPTGEATQYTFLVGPRFRAMNTERHAFDLRALVGGANLDIRLPVSVSTFKDQSWGFSAAFGAAYTVVLNDAISFRVIQPELLIGTAGPGTSVHFRFSTGLVFSPN